MNNTLKKTLFISSCLLMLSVLPASTVWPQSAEQNTAMRLVRDGMAHLHKKNYDAARDSFQEALRYNDADAAGHLGLGIAFFHLRDDSYAVRELERAVELNSAEPVAYQVLGDLYYRKDDLDNAVSNWQKALDLKPDDQDIRSRLDRLKKELNAEKDFNRAATGHFLTKYEGREKNEAGRIVLRILEDAYGVVGRELSYYPDKEVQVILYSEKQFKEVTDAPGWSGGVFDGKIRMPIGGIERETEGLRRILYHEYAHVVVAELTSRCPVWLNEGLAQYFEGTGIDQHRSAVLKQMMRSGVVPSLAGLAGSFAGLGPGQAATAYLVSLSAVRYLVDTYGMYRVRSILDALAAGATIDKAVSDSIMISYAEFETGWKRSLE